MLRLSAGSKSLPFTNQDYLACMTMLVESGKVVEPPRS